MKGDADHLVNLEFMLLHLLLNCEHIYAERANYYCSPESWYELLVHGLYCLAVQCTLCPLYLKYLTKLGFRPEAIMLKAVKIFYSSMLLI